MSVFNLQTSLPHINGNPRHERPIWIWDRDTGGFVWANGEGVKFWSAPSLESLQAMPFDRSHPAWLKVCQILDGLPSSPLQTDKAIGVSLYFPHMNGGAQQYHEMSSSTQPKETHGSFEKEKRDGYFSALCRLGHLKNKTALIVEVVAATERKTEKEIPASELKTTSFETDNHVSGDKPEQDDIYQGDGSSPLSSSVSLKSKGAFKELPIAPTIEELTDLVPKAQLQELARLIQKEGECEDGATEGTLEAPLQELLPIAEEVVPPSTEKAASSGTFSGAVSEAAYEQWRPLEIDFTALAGVSDQEELEALFADKKAAYALISLQKIIHANSSFVSELGYDDIDPLINDGADWLFPKSRDVFAQLLLGEIGTPQIGSKSGLTHVRLRSGRKLVRDVQITPVKLTKFDRTLLLLQLENEFCSGEDVAKKSSLSNESAKNDLPQTFSTGAETTSIPLLSAISHEVRTPLNVILGFSEVMALEQFGPLGNEKYKDYIQDIHSSAQHALSLINDLLDLTKLKAGKWQVEPTEIELNTIVREQVRLMRELAAKRQVRLRSDLEENLPMVKADERSLQQILLNLIANGIKYDKIGGLITVKTLLQDNKTIVLSVSDTGSGMSEAEILQAMEPFHQVIDKSASLNPAYIGDKKSKSGTGLGLPISKALAEANGIDFSIHSKQDVGTEIILTFQAV